MQVDVKYIKDDKIYEVNKQTWKPRKVRVWLLIPLLVLVVLGGMVIFNSLRVETEGATEYNVTGDVDYKVYLKENDYYEEKFLGQGMQYIASLINVVRADFHYELDANDEIQSSYEYKIVATTKALERDDKNKVLYEQEYVLKTGQMQPVEGGKIAIADEIDVDYGKYNEYMRNFRNEFGLRADCVLDLAMIVTVNGEVETKDTLGLSIPLSEQTLDITIDMKGINHKENIGEGKRELYVASWWMLAAGGVIVVISMILIVAVIYYYATRYDGNLYEKALHKILKEYDTYIVEGNDVIYELENVVKVGGFKELLDAQALENAPIVFLEVIPGEKSYFVVNGVNTTYRYTLSKAYQDKLASQGEREF